MTNEELDAELEKEFDTCREYLMKAYDILYSLAYKPQYRARYGHARLMETVEAVGEASHPLMEIVDCIHAGCFDLK